jgi:hypothetical protein
MTVEDDRALDLSDTQGSPSMSECLTDGVFGGASI